MKHLLFASTVLALVTLPLSAQAGNCKLDIQPETSGFFLNPTLNKLTVRSMKSVKPGFNCKLQQGDEIQQINAQIVPGQKAKTVQSYWKGLKPDQPVTFKVLRQGKPLTLRLED